MLLFYKNVSDFTRHVINVFKLAQIRWKLLELLHDSSSLKGSVYLPHQGQKNGKIVSDYFAVLAIILPLIWLLFCPGLEYRHYVTYMWM